jgi:TolB-like protein
MIKNIIKSSLITAGLLSTTLFADGMNYNKELIESVSVGYKSNSAVRFNKTVQFLGDQLAQNKDLKNINDSLIAITSFVDLSNFDATNMLGNLLSESLIHEMQIRGFGIVDYKMMKSIKIQKDGDFMLSRNVNEIKKDFKLNYSLTGTYSKIGSGVLINARIIDLRSNRVVSTAQAFINKRDYESIVNGDENDTMYGKEKSPKYQREIIAIEPKI